VLTSFVLKDSPESTTSWTQPRKTLEKGLMVSNSPANLKDKQRSPMVGMTLLLGSVSVVLELSSKSKLLRKTKSSEIRFREEQRSGNADTESSLT
jgi:hypothetical protein